MKRKLNSEYKLIPEGRQTVKITKVDDTDYEKFQKLVITIEDATGATARCNFNFVNEDGTPNDVADGIYTRMCRAALNDQTLDECDSEELLGCFVEVEIQHSEGKQGGTFANVKKWIGSGKSFDGAKAPAAAPKPAGKKTAAQILAEAREKAAKKA